MPAPATGNTARSASGGRTKAAREGSLPCIRASHGAGMSTTVQLFSLFFLLCAVGAVGALLAPERWNSIVLAAIGSLSAFVILLVSALLLVADVSFRAELWQVLSLGKMT